MNASVLLTEADPAVRGDLSRFLEHSGHSVRSAQSASEARISVAEHSPDVAVLGLPLPDASGLELAHALLADDPELGILLILENPARYADEALSVTQFASLGRPVNVKALDRQIRSIAAAGRARGELAWHRRRTRDSVLAAGLPESVERLIDLAARNTDSPVLITGESGTGKDAVARLIHSHSVRGSEPFLELDCRRTSRTVQESHLFGHERGASADERRARRSLFELAGAGCVYLSGVTGLSFELQGRLLQLVEAGHLSRAGGSSTVASGARVLAAADNSLAQSVADGSFRPDLFYRLQVLTIPLPALRERPDSIESTARAMLPPGFSLTPAAVLALQQHSWPGNLRELNNALWRARLVAQDGVIDVQHLPLTATLESPAAQLGDAGRRGRLASRTPSLKLQDLERRAILSALEQTGGNKLRAARLLGIARSTLHEKLRRL